MFRTFAPLLVAALIVPAIFPAQAFAYLDPGTGSYIFQMVVAGLLGAAFAVKMSWVRIKGFLARVFSRGPSND